VDDAVRALDAVPDDLPGKRLFAAVVFAVAFLMAVLVYFTPAQESESE
jgi:hypothetical protein